MEAIRIHRESTGAGLAESQAFVERLEAGASPKDHSREPVVTPSSPPPDPLLDYGWHVERLDDGGLLLRRSTLWRGAMLGCSSVAMLFFSPILLIGLYAARQIPGGDPLPGVWRIVELLVPLGFLGIVSLIFLGLMSVIVRLALWREVWEAHPDRLIVRRGPLGFLRTREHRGGALLVEPHHDRGERVKQWRLAILADGEKHYLLPDIRLGFMRRMDAHREATSVAKLLAEYTGWTVSETAVAIDGLARPPSESEEAELMAALRSHRIALGSDEQMRLLIRSPRTGQWIFGAVLLGIGGVWIWILTGAVDSYLRDPQVQQEPALQQLPFWLMMTPMLAAGAAMCALGVACLFGRQCWIIDRNLVLARSRLFGWTSEHEYVNARWKLALVRRTSSKGGTTSTWQVQLESLAGKTLKVLYTDPDDDAPRLLATLISRRTGWDLRESSF